MEPLSLIVALAIGLASKYGIDAVLSKSPKVASLNERIKAVLIEFESAIRAQLIKNDFKPATVDKLLSVINKKHLSKADIEHLKHQDPKLYSEFLKIVERYDTRIAASEEEVKKELARPGRVG